jgi:hypothetical protein
MTLIKRYISLLALALAAPSIAALTACDKSSGANLAPTASALASSGPATATATKFAIDKPSSRVDFMMEAPEEKIRGKVAGASTGDLSIDVHHLDKTSGLITVDISGIELYQTKPADGGGPGVEQKNDLQNTHARAWLEISPDAPEDIRKTNSNVQFSITSIDKTSVVDVTTLTGAVRKVTVTATGDFLLHGRKNKKTVDLEATFAFDGDKPTSVELKTVKPFAVGLAEYDVKPRESFGKLAQKTLEILSPKVAKDAEVTFDLTAKAAP